MKRELLNHRAARMILNNSVINMFKKLCSSYGWTDSFSTYACICFYSNIYSKRRWDDIIASWFKTISGLNRDSMGQLGNANTNRNLYCGFWFHINYASKRGSTFFVPTTWNNVLAVSIPIVWEVKIFFSPWWLCISWRQNSLMVQYWINLQENLEKLPDY